MISLELFLRFFEVGAVSFGGGYGMISLIQEITLTQGWLTQEELMNFIAVAESTPGPIAVNMATFVGSSQGGLLGAFAATLGVVLPSFLIILLIAAVLRGVLQFRPVQGFLQGVRPCIVALILTAAVTMMLSKLMNFQSVGDHFCVDWMGVAILAVLTAAGFLYQKMTAKQLSPIFLILLSAALGMLLYAAP